MNDTFRFFFRFRMESSGWSGDCCENLAGSDRIEPSSWHQFYLRLDAMAEEKMQKLGPGPTIFEAELGLLKSLGKERIAHNKDNPYANVGDDDLTRADLTQFRNDLGLKLKRKEALEEVEAVRALDHQDLPPEKSSTDFVRLKNAYSRRKHKHDKALKAYKKNVVTTSDELELHVIQESRALKELLEQIKNEQYVVKCRTPH